MRILYLGLPLGALALARAGFRPAAVAIGHPGAPGTRRVRRELGSHGVLILGRPNLHDPSVVYALASIEADVLLSWFWPRLVPPEVLSLSKRGAFGVHPSLLPRWRGPDPYFWAIRAGDAETGVTLHRLEEQYDTGAVIARHALAVGASNAWQLARRLDGPGLSLLVECAQRLARGESLDGVPQDDALATEAPAPTEEDLAIDWKTSAREVVRLVRAASPWPGATARVGETDVEIVEAAVCEEAPPRALAPSEAWQSREGWAVCTSDGAVLVQKARDEDGRDVPVAHLFEALNAGRR